MCIGYSAYGCGFGVSFYTISSDLAIFVQPWRMWDHSEDNTAGTLPGVDEMLGMFSYSRFLALQGRKIINNWHDKA